jgi:hypothetical protein
MKPEYEKPVALPLGEAVKGLGACAVGSAVMPTGTSYCTPGATGPFSTCQTGDAGAVIACQTGDTGTYVVYGCFGGTAPSLGV